MSAVLTEISRIELVTSNIWRTYGGVSVAESEILELLLDEAAFISISQSLTELEDWEGMLIDEW